MNTRTRQSRIMLVVSGLVAMSMAEELRARPMVNVITFTRGASGGTTSSPAQNVEPPGGSFAFGNDDCNSLGGSQFANSSGDAVSASCHFASAGAHADQQVSADCLPGGTVFSFQALGHGGASADSYGPDTSVSASCITGAHVELLVEVTAPARFSYYATASVLNREIIGAFGGSGSGAASSSITITGPQGINVSIALGANVDNYPGVGDIRQGDICAPPGLYHVVFGTNYAAQASASGGVCTTGPGGVWQGTVAGSLSLNFYAASPGTCLPCPADVNGSHTVDIDDLVAVITSWGRCL